ncbi:hypothetical protein HK104_001543, partial [Borealophlyctis nickersoniae]
MDQNSHLPPATGSPGTTHPPALSAAVNKLKANAAARQREASAYRRQHTGQSASRAIQNQLSSGRPRTADERAGNEA